MIVDPDFCDHWKTRMLVGLLEGDEAAPVYVLRIWAHCQNRRQGQFENLPPEALKALCRFPGHSNKLEASLVTSGFIRREGDSVIVVNWEIYNAGLIASWNNGGKGGRPKNNPRDNPRVSVGITQFSKSETKNTKSGNEREIKSADTPFEGSEKTLENKDVKPTGKPTGLRVDRSREDKSREREEASHTHYGGALKNLIDGQMIPPEWSDQQTLRQISEWCEFFQRNDEHGRAMDPVTLREQLKECGGWSADRLRRSILLTMGRMKTHRIFDADIKPPKKASAPSSEVILKKAKRIDEL